MPTNMPTNDVAPESPALDYRELLPKEEAKPLTAEEAWNASPFPATRPMWSAEGSAKTDNRGETMRRAIMEDPFAPFDRELLPQLAAYAGESAEGTKNAVTLAKKMTAARFLANAVNLDFPDAVANFPALASAFFGEKIDDPNLVYAKLREIYQAEFAPRPGLAERLGRDVNTGVLAAGKGFPDMANAAIETSGIVGDALNYGFNKPLEWLSRKVGWQGGEQYFGQFANSRYQKRSPWLDEIAENYRKEMNYQQQQRGPAAGFGEELTGAVIQNLPNTLLSLMFAEAKLFGTIGATSAYFGATGFAGELSDTREDSSMSEGGRIANALIVGTAETVFEEKFGMGRIARKYFRTGIPAAEARKLSTAFGATLARTGRALGMDAAGEGFEEIMTGATQRFSNLVFNRDGKSLAGMSTTELFHELCDPMPLEFSTGAVIGGGMGAAGIGSQFRRQRTQAQIHNFRAGVFGEARQELEKLRKKENPTEDEVRTIETLDGALKSGDVLPVLNLEAERIVAAQEAERLDELPTGEWAEELAAKAVRQEKELQADRRLKPAELAAAPVTEAVWRELEELQREYGGAVEVELANTPEALPEHIRSAPNYTPGAEGAFDPSTGKIWLVGGNLEPGRVKKVLLHEAVGHKGLRNVFGAKFDVFLDAIARDFESDVSVLAEKREIDFTTAAGRLEAADEFLATRAENIEENPKLWKRITAAVRRWLRTLPGLHELRYTDAEIQSLLRRANRAVKKGAAETRAAGVRFSADPETEVRAVQVPDVGIDFSDTAAARQYLRERFLGMEVTIRSDGRLVLFTGKGINDSLKKRGVHREAFPALDRILEEAVPAGYRPADAETKHGHLAGQHIYASLLEVKGEAYAARILLDESKADTRAYFKDITLKKIEDALYVSSGEQVAGSLPAASSTKDAMPSSSGESAGFLDASSAINIKRLVELVNPETDGNQENADGIRFSVVTDPELLERLESGKIVKVYRAAQMIDGKLYPPMAAKVDGRLTQSIELGKWEQADERADLVKNGKFKLDKANGSAIQAAYNPYFHTSRSPLNDQFSSAYKRPNLVTLEVEVPAEELTSGYKAEGAKDAVGEMEWHSGPVSSKLTGDRRRRVILSRWDKPVRIVPDSEVADRISEMLDGTGLSVPANVITPSLRNELEKRDIGVDDGIRFSVSPEYSRRVNRLAQILAPHTKNGQEMLEEAEAAALLQNAGIEIDAEADRALLHEAAWQARELIRERNQKVKTKSEETHLRKKDPYYAVLSEKYGPDFKIAPGPAYEGRKFTGSWVDKRKLPKNQTGVKLSEAAKTISDATGKTVSESAVMAYFADLKRETLLKDLRDTKARRRELKTAAEEMAEIGAEGRNAKSFLAERNRWLYDRYPFIRAAVDFGGDKFQIVPSMRYEGTEFTGSWISPAWKNWSARKKSNKSGLAAIEADNRRLDKLSGAEGIASDELAQSIARREGGDPLEIEENLVEFFRDLKKQELFRQFYAERADGAAQAAELEREAKAGEKEARTSAEANARAAEYKALLDEALKDKLDIVRVQQLAAAYARRNLKKELRGEFIQRVADLSKYTADISPAYPDGRRMHELEKLLADIQTFDIVDRIGELLDKYKPTVNRTGQRISPIGDAEQETLAQIRAILAMPAHAVANRIAELSEQLNAVAEESSEQGRALEEELELLRIFGALERKSRDDAWSAFRMLSALIEGKRESFLNRLREKREDLGRKQYQAVIETTGNEDGLPRTGKNDKEPKRSKYILMQRNLRGLLELVTNRSDKEFDETVLGKLFSRLEESTWKNATFDRESNTRVEQAIARIFKLDTLAKKAAFWSEAEKAVEKTGIFVDRYSRPRQYAQNRFGLVDGRGFYTASITPENAKKLLQNAADGKAELDPLAAEFLRQQLDDFEHGVEQEWQLFGNEDENSAFNAFVKRSRKEQKLTVFHPDKNAEKERVELSISRAEGATLLMDWEQPDVQARMRWNGWTDESIEQLKQFIGRDFTEFAYWSRQEIAETGEKLDAASRAIYGIGIPRLTNYYPVSYKETLGKQIGKGKTESYLGYGYGQMSVNPSFLIKRKFHLSDVDLHRSIFQAHLQHQIEVNHFLSWGESIREARGILNNRQVRQAISGTYGTEVYNQILDRVTVLANGGRDSGQAVELMGRLFRYWVPSKIALNFSSVLKQFAGSVSYMNEVPMADFMKNFAETFTGSEDFRRFAEYATGSDFYKDRKQGGFSRDLMYLTKSNRSGKIADVYGNALIDKGTYLTRWADSVSALRGGYAAFKYHYDNLLERGMEPGAAWEEAARRWKRTTDETQQSGYLKDQNRFQSDAGAYRYLTSFLSNPIQIMNLELMTIDDIRFGKGKRREEALKKLPRQIFVNHVMLPTMMVLITQLFRKGFDYDEYEWEDFATASLLGPFDGAFMAGKILQAAADSFGGLMLGRGWRPGQTVAEALPMFDDAILGGVRMEKLAMELLEGGQPDGAEYYGAVQGMADLLMTGGTVLPLPYVGAGGATGSALMRELKRMWRLFGPSEPEKPRLKF